MVSVRNVIVEAYRMVGMLSDGQALDGTQSLVGVQLLNNMVGSLNLEGFFASSMVQLAFTPTVSKLSYTIGIQEGAYPPPDISAQRPSHLRRVYAAYAASGVPMELPIVGAQDIYQFMPSQTAVGVPRFCAYLSNYPYGEIQFNVQPSVAFQFFVCYNKAIPRAEFDDSLVLPPEYQPALTYGLSYVLAQRNGRPAEVVAGMMQMREEAYNQIRTNVLNSTPLTAHLNAYDQINGGNIIAGAGY